MKRFRNHLAYIALTLLLLASGLTISAGAAIRRTRPTAGSEAPQSAGQAIQLSVDATEAPRKILHARLVIPASPGALTLYYPKWLPGEHGPTGPNINLAGLKFTAGGQTLPWQRDLLDMYAIHLDVPAGASSVEASLDYLLPSGTSGFSSAASSSAQLVVVSWNQLLLYPRGSAANTLTYIPSLRLPTNWKYGTALHPVKNNGDSVEFQPVSLYTLVDSPVIAGAFFRAIPLTEGQNPPHELDLVSDSAEAIRMPLEMIAEYKQLVAEAGALFGARHYTQYHFLFTLSDYVASFGLEHHESSDDRVSERALLDENLRRLAAGLLPHEFVHSWNGKYRRPADLTTPDYEKPMETDLLWVYEGLTEYLGLVLTARSGLWTPEEYRENVALVAGQLDKKPGRTWRPLIDTTIDAQILYNAPGDWAAYRRGVDFYDEGVLIWLDADAKIRQLTKGRKSLDDFCKLFHGGKSGPPAVETYTFDDVVKALNEVAANDWRSFLNERLTSVSPNAPLGGIENSGWKLVFNDTPNVFITTNEAIGRGSDLSFSLGMTLREDGTIGDVWPGRPAALAGLGPGMRVIAVNGRRYNGSGLRDAVRNSKTETGPIELLIENAEFFKTIKIDYHNGERQPHLERNQSQPDLLEQIIKPHAPKAG